MSQIFNCRSVRTVAGLLAGAAVLCAIHSSHASAAEGAIQNGVGARNKALAGAGVAHSTDATAASLNPAGLANVQSQVNVAVSALNMDGGVTAPAGSGINPPGRSENDADWMAIPNVAVNWRVNWGIADAIAFTAYGNGGVSTNYSNDPNANCGSWGGGSGVFCRGDLGLKVSQTLLSVALAKTVAPGLSVGVAPILARQTLKADGASLFAGYSSDSSNLTNRGEDVAWGAGVRGGVEWRVHPDVKVGIAANSLINMEKHDKYRGLLADGADLDIPPMMQTGISWGLGRGVTLMADYKRIWYSAVEAIGNPSTLFPTMSLGSVDGPGFGVQNVSVYKIGLEWQYSPALMLRAGYSYNTAPIKPRDADFNLLTLGVVQHHFTAGMKYALSASWDLELAAMYAPRESVQGIELLVTPARAVEIDMQQAEVTVGLTYRFGSERTATYK